MCTRKSSALSLNRKNWVRLCARSHLSAGSEQWEPAPGAASAAPPYGPRSGPPVDMPAPLTWSSAGPSQGGPSQGPGSAAHGVHHKFTHVAKPIPQVFAY